MNLTPNQVLADKVRTEVSRALRNDDSVIGEVFRLLEKGLSDNEIGDYFETSTKNFVWNARRNIRAMLDGDLPTAPTVARGCAGAIRGLLRRQKDIFSGDVLAELEHRINQLNETSEDSAESEAEIERVRSGASVHANVVGIYVYTLPHYFKNPVEPAADDALSDRTLFKIGKSDADVIKRFNSQLRNTSLPEDPWLVRIYTGTEGKGDVEKRFHKLVGAADHRRSRGKVAGTEWFLTSLKFLDALASDMNLTRHFSIEDVI